MPQALKSQTAKETSSRYETSLPKGTILQQEYRIRRAISWTELSVGYIVYHQTSRTYLFLKEFFPASLAIRDLDHKGVLCRMPSTKKQFQELKQSFLSEAEILREVRHKHIVRYVDHFEENGTSYIVTEYCRGRTLDKVIHNNHKRWPFSLLSVGPLIDALEHLHKRGIIHRDIKPQNIMVNHKGELKLFDFGSAIHFSNQTNQRIFTSIGYSPLELYSATSQQGPHSDLYSLCAVLYFCLCGKAPLDVSQRLIEDEIEPIQSCANRNVNPLLASLIMRGLTVSAARRRFSLRFLQAALSLERFFLKDKPTDAPVTK
ncbi:serine/threonine protein kinase [Brevibacillus dissolubilis]|uniref:serine/threonine protein kinase n=1 Tax=Brevibacillus dissolubilis TaxID=1844116 RepID=UPI0011161C5B|nr:serine/threonine-protein kinase [Brevibacillus dissolubilis]